MDMEEKIAGGIITKPEIEDSQGEPELEDTKEERPGKTRPITFEEYVLTDLRSLVRKCVQVGKFSPDTENINITLKDPKGKHVKLFFERDPVDFIEEIETFFDSVPNKEQRAKFFQYLSKVINMMEYQEVVMESVGSLIAKVIMDVDKKLFNKIIIGLVKHKNLKKYLFDFFSMAVARIDEISLERKDNAVEM